MMIRELQRMKIQIRNFPAVLEGVQQISKLLLRLDRREKMKEDAR